MGSSRKRDFLPGHGPYAPLADASRVRVRNQGSSRTCNEADKLLLLKKSKFGEWARRCHDFTTTPPTSRKDMRWTCASRDGRQDHLRQDLAKPRCCMVSGGAEPTMVKTTTTMGVGTMLASDGCSMFRDVRDVRCSRAAVDGAR